MNYRHCNNSHTFPVAVTCRQSYTADLMLVVELKKRGYTFVRVDQMLED